MFCSNVEYNCHFILETRKVIGKASVNKYYNLNKNSAVRNILNTWEVCTNQNK